MKKIVLTALTLIILIGGIAKAESNKKATDCCNGGACCLPTASCCLSK